MKTLQEKYNAIQEGNFPKNQFLIEARKQFPNLVTQYNGYEDAVNILKNRGVIFEEAKYEVEEPNTFSDEDLRRGIDYELDHAGLDSAESHSEKDMEKAKKKALKNLKKDRNHYLHIISGESKNVDKHDQMEKATDKNTVDTYNGMKKADLREAVAAELKKRLEEGRRKKVQGGKVVKEGDYDSDGYVETMGPLFDKGVEMILKAFTEWKEGPMTEPGMVPFAKRDVLSYLTGEIDRILSIDADMSEEAKPDYIDADGDGDKEESMKKAFQDKEKAQLKEAFKKVIKNILSEEKQPLNEAGCRTLESYINYENEQNEDLAARVRENAAKLSKHIQEVEEAYLKLRENVGQCCTSCGDYMGPALMEAFKQDLAPVMEKYITMEYKSEAAVEEAGEDHPGH